MDEYLFSFKHQPTGTLNSCINDELIVLKYLFNLFLTQFSFNINLKWFLAPEIGDFAWSF